MVEKIRAPCNSSISHPRVKNIFAWALVTSGSIGETTEYMKQNLQLPVSIKKIIPTCYHRNKGEVENMGSYTPIM